MRSESPYAHGTALKTAVVLVNLGTPDAPTAPALRKYLKEFLSDPRVVEIPRLVWWLILNGIILRIRPKKSAAKYATVWTPDGSPLMAIAKKQTQALSNKLSADGYEVTVKLAMRYGNPSVNSILDELRASHHDRVLVLPLFPQYAAATVASVFDAVANWMRPVRNVPEFRFVKHYHDNPIYIQGLVNQVLAYWDNVGRPDFWAGDRLLMSFHGVPKRTLEMGDPYHCECYKTARLVAQGLGISQEHVLVTFQSRFGKAEWLQPYTDKTLQALPSKGTHRVDVMCPGFVADCLETLEEIAQEGRDEFLHAGGKTFNYIPCLNDSNDFTQLLADVVIQHTSGWPVWKHDQEVLAENWRVSEQQARQLGARS